MVVSPSFLTLTWPLFDGGSGSGEEEEEETERRGGSLDSKGGGALLRGLDVGGSGLVVVVGGAVVRIPCSAAKSSFILQNLNFNTEIKPLKILLILKKVPVSPKHGLLCGLPSTVWYNITDKNVSTSNLGFLKIDAIFHTFSKAADVIPL